MELSLKTILKHNNVKSISNPIVLMYRGSYVHGTVVTESESDVCSTDDLDVIGISIPVKEYFFGVPKFKTFEQIEIFEGKWDILIYEFRKAVFLMAKSNPSMLNLLWTPDDFILTQTDEFKLLRDNRNLFLSKRVYYTFCNYAINQLKKIEREYYSGYMKDKRRKIREQFGYDTKHAQHLIRILRQGIEVLTTGQLNVVRQDANELKDIKLGKWSMIKIKEESDRLFVKLEDAYNNTKLPPSIDTDKINNLVSDILYNYWYKNNE